MGKKLDTFELRKLPKTEAEAIRNGERYFFTGQPCKNGHVSQRVLQKKGSKFKSECYECISIRSKKYRAANKEKMAGFNLERRSAEYRSKVNKQRRDKYKSQKEYRDYVRSKTYKGKYGLNIEKYDELFKSQSGKCAICGKSSKEMADKKRLAVDHDHKTGQIRGLLCSDCNTMLGHFHDDPKLCIKAASYLDKAGDYRDNEYLKSKLRGRKAIA